MSRYETLTSSPDGSGTRVAEERVGGQPCAAVFDQDGGTTTQRRTRSQVQVLHLVGDLSTGAVRCSVYRTVFPSGGGGDGGGRGDDPFRGGGGDDDGDDGDDDDDAITEDDLDEMIPEDGDPFDGDVDGGDDAITETDDPDSPEDPLQVICQLGSRPQGARWIMLKPTPIEP